MSNINRSRIQDKRSLNCKQSTTSLSEAKGRGYLCQTNKFAKVSVADTGIGISLENQKRLFDRFYRVEVARSEIKGYGLGLSICKAIIERHHGTITVNSNLHQGSTFTVLLPLGP